MKKRSAFAAVAVMLFAVGLGVAYATIPDSQGAIHACYKTDSGQLRVVDSSACNASETPLSWSQAGSQGAQGPPGPQGPAGPAGPGNAVYSEVASGGGGQSIPVGLPAGIAEIPLPAGKYTVIASLTVGNDAFDPNFVRCRLLAGSDSDEADADLGALTDPGASIKLELNLVHEFAAASTARIYCGGHAEASWIGLQITAVSASSITTVPFTPASG